MSLDFISSALLGQADQAAGSEWWWTLLRLFIALPLPWFLGQQLAKYLRMPDYGWKLSLIFCTLACAAVIVQAGTLKKGVDLEGGDILVYEVDRNALRGEDDSPMSSLAVDWGKLIEAISERINPSGTKEIVVRRYGEWQLEIIIPKVDRREIDRIKKLISTAGSLEFRIVAKRNHAQHGYVIGLAETAAGDPNKQRSKNVRDGDNKIVGYWSRVARVDPDVEAVADDVGALRVQVASDVIRNAATGELITLPSTYQGDRKYALEKYLIDQGIKEVDVLMIVDKDLHVTGEHLGMVSRGYDETMRPCVRFNTKGQGIGLMAGLTGSNLPDPQRNFYQKMAILLDGEVLTAPRIMSTIADRGQITGNFTKDEVDDLVGILHAGSLPAAVNEEPISENQIGAVLGEDTIRRGTWAIGISLGAVLVFILVWYRFAGIVACLALAVNLLLILALMITFNAAVTLPGLAGLVLTVGMSVDANVLIFERLREELNRGAALRMAIRNGFSRATTTIVDANLTTLITALVLYAIGTDQIRGFAVTLILGILMSMFTAIFCSRVVFDLFERKRRLKSLKMRRVVGDTHIDFIGKRMIAAVVSTVLIVVGLVAVGLRGAQIFDIDFAGGTSVTMILQEETDETEIRSKLDKAFASEDIEGSSVQYSVNRVDVEGEDANTVWKIDASYKKAEKLQGILQSQFPVATFSMDFGTLTESIVPATPKKDKATGPDGKEPTGAGEQPRSKEKKPAVEPKETSPQPAKGDKASEEPKEPSKPTKDAKDASKPTKAAATEEKKAQESGDGKPDESPKDKPEPDDQGASRTDLPPDNVLAVADDGVFLLALADPPEDAPGDAAEAKPKEETVPAKEAPAPAKTAPADDETPAAKGEAKAEEKPAVKPSAKPVDDEAKTKPDAKPADAKPKKPEAAPTSEEPKEAAPAEKPAAEEMEPPPAEEPKPENKPAAAKDEMAEPEDKTPAEKPVEKPSSEAKDVPPTDKPVDKPVEKPVTVKPSDAPKTEDTSEKTGEPPTGGAKTKERLETQTQLTFTPYEINGLTLQAEILEAANAVNIPLIEEDVAALQPVPLPDADWWIEDSRGFTVWDVTLPVAKDKAGKIYQHMKEKMDDTPYWLSSSAIGSKVAGDTRTLAIAALLASLFGIVGYIWIRFQHVVFGLAAVVALVHDVLITLGAIGVSYWLAGIVGFQRFLLIEEFKISLPVVAAFLTIIGYSLNDTIVVFDRIREVRGKRPDLTSDMVNTSINQTLSRTLLTSLTTFLVVMILYSLGGQGIHGFAFALVIGVIVGTYSSIFVASPALLWMSQAKKAA